MLADRGVRVAAVPTVEIRSEPAGGRLDAALRGDWSWIVVTSPTGARVVCSARRRVGATRAAGRWAAVGPATAGALQEGGIRPDLVATRPSGAWLAEDLIAASPSGRLDGQRILLARADAASADLPSGLRDAGADVTEVVAYRTVEAPYASGDLLLAALDDPALAAIVVASGSAVRGLARLAPDEAATARLHATPLVAIGRSTSRVAEALGFPHIVVAATPAVEALADAVDATIANRARTFPVLSRSRP
jgi:uroporphyrinogen-III synthase